MRKISLFPALHLLLVVVLLCRAEESYSQKKDSSIIQISGYVDAYYAYYTDSVKGEYQQFPSVSPRTNQFGLNVAMFTAKYSAENIHGAVTLHYGDIPRCAWSAKYNFIQEANAGIRLCSKIWFDGGFFRSHLGTEALFPKENYTSSVAVPTFFEPYYEAGFRLNYIPSEKLSLFLYALKGYGMYEDNNRKKSSGLLVTYVFNEKLNIGYSGYYGDDSPDKDTLNHFRQMHNAFLNYNHNKIKFTAGIDYCMQQNSDTSRTKNASMITGLAIVKYQFIKKSSTYFRGELFNDPQGMMSGAFADKTGKHTGYKIGGATLGIEYKPTDNSYIRLEGRELIADKDQEIFYWNLFNTNARTELMINMGVSF